MFRSILLLSLSVGCTEYGVGKIVPPSAGMMDTGVASVDTPDREDPEEEPEEEDDCVESSTAFDIEEVSGLQDAFGLAQVRDGLMLELDESYLEGERTWRPVSVEVLVMYPTWYFDFYDDSNELSVNFHPTATPAGSAAFSKTIQIRKSDLDWSPLTLPAGADWSADDLNQMAAWLEFDLSDVVPETGFRTTDYFVSLSWDSMGFPNVGYSNFELNCAQNWTDYGSGSYVQNTGEDCSWPMMKIEVETLSPGDCE
jgi:hypothetical protein